MYPNAQNEINGPAYGQLGNAAQQQAQPVRDATMLEAHLGFLHHAQQQATEAVHRAMQLADRLLGVEPPMIGKNENVPKSPAEPPLFMKLENASRELEALLGMIHQQLTRLERI